MAIDKIQTRAADLENLEIAGTEGARLPVGTTAEREGSPKAGDQRFNSTTSLMEYYDGTQWKSIDAPPVVSSISPTTETDANADITISGSNFSSGATVKFIGNDGTEYNSPTVTVNSSTEIVAQTPATALTVANEPYDIQVTNNSGLSGTLADALDAGSAPTWTTASGNIGTIYEDEAISSLSIAATDADGQSVSITSSDFSITGVTLNSDGTITGTPNVNDTYASGGVTHTFDGIASDGTNTTTRTFNILRKWIDGSSSATAVSATSQLSTLGISTNGYYWIKPANTSAKQMYVYFSKSSKNWVVIGRHASNMTTYTAAPGFYNDGNTPGPGANGSISLFDFSDAQVGNSTNFMWYDYNLNCGALWLCANLTSIKAAPDTFSNTNDSFQIRMQSEYNWNSSTPMHQFVRLNTYQGGNNTPNFTYSTSTSTPTGTYGKNLYYGPQSADNDYRAFSLSNGSGYEAAYTKGGLTRYNPSPYYVGTNILTLMEL
jgi:hypothetical protein